MIVIALVKEKESESFDLQPLAFIGVDGGKVELVS